MATAGPSITLKMVETLHYVDLRTIKIRDSFLQKYAKDLRPGEYRAFTNERETRWRWIICLDEGEYGVYIPSVDADGQIRLYIDHASFCVDVAAKTDTRTHIQTVIRVRTNRHQKYLTRKSVIARNKAKKAKAAARKKTNNTRKKSKGSKR